MQYDPTTHDRDPVAIKILVCTTGFLPAAAFGGLPYSTFNLCKALISAGASVRVVTTDRNGDNRLKVETDCWTAYEGVQVWYARTWPGPFLYAPSARRAIRAEMATVDCVVNSGTIWSHSGLLAWREARRRGKPSITYLRGVLEPWAFHFKRWRKRAWWHLFARRILRDSSVIVALNDAERQNIRDMGVTTRIEVIPNGAAVGGDVATIGRSLVDDALPTLAGRRYVLFLGRVHQKKGLDLLIPAIAELLPKVKDTSFVVAGPIDADYARAFAELVRSHSLEAAIALPGTVSGELKTALLKHAHVFVLPSRSEGLPVAVLEALLCGCPVVISRQCNLPEVQHAGAGLVIDLDRKQLADAIMLMFEDEPRRLDMGARARALAEARFDWDAIGRRTLRLCEEVVGVNTGPPASRRESV